MRKGGTVAEFAIWEHGVHTQRCKLTPIAWEPLNVTKFSGCLDMVVYFHSSFSQHMLKYTVACFPKHGILCHPAKTRDWLSRNALFRPPSSNHHINICFKYPAPMEQHFSLPFPSCAFSNSQFKTGGKTDPGSLLTSRHVFKCISAVPRHNGSGQMSRSGASVKIPQMPTWNNERWPSLQCFSTNSPLCWIPTSCVPLCENHSGI